MRVSTWGGKGVTFKVKFTEWQHFSQVFPNQRGGLKISQGMIPLLQRFLGHLGWLLCLWPSISVIDQNSKFELWILLNAYCLCTRVKLKNCKSNNHKSRTICILDFLFFLVVPMSTAFQPLNKNYFWVHIQINSFIFWTHQLLRVMLHFILLSIWNLDALKCFCDFIFAFICWEKKKILFSSTTYDYHFLASY